MKSADNYQRFFSIRFNVELAQKIKMYTKKVFNL